MIVITDSTSFTGSHLLLELLKKNESVIAIKQPTSDISYTQQVFALHHASPLFNKIQWQDIDLTKFYDVVEVFNGVDVVFHTTAQASLHQRNNKTQLFHQVKIIQNVVNAALLQSVKRFGYVSSIATITNYFNGKGVENAPFEILTSHQPQTLSINLSELEVWRAIQEGLPAVIINPSFILGYSPCWHYHASHIHDLIKKFSSYPAGTGSFIDIQDVVSILMQLTIHTSITNQRFILTSENIRYHDFFKLWLEQWNIDKPLKPISKNAMLLRYYLNFMSWKKSDCFSPQTANLLYRDITFSNEKICDTLQHAFIPIKESIKTMYDYNTFLSK